MPGKAKLYILIAIMAAVALSSSLVAGWLQYESAVDNKKAVLVSMVKHEREALEGKLDLKNKPKAAIIEKELLNNLKKHIDEDLRFDKFGTTGEFVLARMVGKNISFLLTNRNLQVKQRKIDFESALAEPMRRALMGFSGSVIGIDYKGDTVVAAYESLGTIGLGLVAKVDIDEIRAPFLKAGLIAALAALALMALGAVLFYSIINPIIIKARANEETFRKLYDHAPAMMHSIDQTGSIQYVNNQWLEFLGYQRDEVIGKKIFDFQTKESIEKSKAAVNDLVKFGRVNDIPIQIIKKNGEPRDVYISAISQTDDSGQHIGSLSVLTDVSEKTRAEAKLFEAVESFTSGFALYDSDERLVLCNENYKKSLQHLKAELTPGITKEDQLRSAANSGAVTEAIGNEDEWVAQRLQDFRSKSGTYLRETVDGTWVKVDNYPTESGGTATVRTDISNLKQAEKEIEDSEKRFNTLFNSFNQGIIIHRNHEVLFANQALAEMYGYDSVEEILALNNSLDLIPPRNRDIEAPSKSLAGDQSYNEETLGFRKDGTEFWISKHVFLIDWDGERATCSLRIDISDKKQAEAAIHASEEKFRSVFDSVGQGILIHRNRKPLYANQALVDIYGYDSIKEILSLKNTGVLTAPEYLTDRHFRRIAGESLPVDIEIIGKRKDGSEFWVDKRSFRIMWDGEPAMCSIRHDITDRKQAEENIKASELRFRTIFDSCNFGILVHRAGKFLYANKAAAEIYGYETPAEITALKSNTELIAPGSPRNNTYDLLSKENLEKITADGEYKGLKKDGTHVWIGKRSFGLLWDGQPAVCSFRSDISLRKTAEEELKNNEAQFRTFMDTLPMAVNVKDTDGRYLLVNKRFEEWYGNHSDYLIGKTIFDNYGDDDPELTKSVTDHVQEVLRTGKQITQYRKRILPDGRVRDLEVIKFPIHDDSGNIIRTGSITADVTERIQAEEALRESESQFRTFTDQLPMAINIKTVDGKYIHVNKRIEEWHSVTKDELIGKTRVEAIGDYTGNIFEIVTAHEQEVIETGKAVTQYRNRQLPDGRIRDFETSKFPILDDNGNIIRIGSISTDITERKQAEEALRLSELRFRGALETMQEGFALYDFDDRLITCNEEYLRLHPFGKDMIKPGMLFEDMIRHHVMAGKNADVKGDKEEFIKNRMEQHRNPRGPIIRHTSDDRWFIINESRTPDGGYSILETDITELKRTEIALRESEDRFRTLFNSAPQGIMVFRNYKALYANQAFAEMHGYDSPDDILSLESTQQLLAPEYRRNRHTRRLQGEDLATDEEYECLHKDGSRFWVEKRSFVINWGGEKAACTIRTNIDQRRKAEDALRESEERFRTLFNTSPQGILVHRNHIPLYANPALAEIYGYTSPDDIMAMPSTQALIMEEDRRESNSALILASGDSLDKEYRGLRKNGDAFWIAKRSFGIIWDGEPAICSMRTDVTERKEADEKIRRSEELFRNAIDGLQEGFALYDANDRLVIFNDVFKRLHPSSKDIIRPGMSWHELLDSTLKSGLNAQALGREEAYRKERTEQHKNPQGPLLRQTIDGTWRIVNEAKLPDGSTVAIQTDITELKKLEDEALRAQTQLLAAIESIEGGFSLYGPDDRLVLSNSNNQKFFENVSDLYKPGIRFDEILRARADRGLIDGIEGDLDQWVKDRLKRFHQRKPSVHLRQDRDRWMQINEYPTSDGGKALIRTDITESKLTMDALYESEERFKTLIESSNQGIIIHRNNRPLYANNALATMFGFKSSKDILALSSTKKLLKPAQKTNGQINMGLSSNEDEFLTAKYDGTPIWVNNRAFEIDWEGKTATCTTLFDITERKTAESQLIQTSKLASLGELASSVAHELNQPLSITRIVAESTMMKAEENTLDSDYLQKQLSAICDQSERMANITNHLRLFSRLDEGDVTIFDPVESLTNAFNLIEKPFVLSGIKLTKRLPKISHPVLGSGFKLEQVILNLLNNAADAVNDQVERMEDDGKNYTPRISISLSDSKKSKEVIIRIRDNGGGIKQIVLERIFDPFFTTKEAEQGTGLGLSISFGIVKSMQGELTATNDKNGALFTIKLPAQPISKTAAKTKRKKRTPAPSKSVAKTNGKKKSNGKENGQNNGNGRHVLVVDDEQLAAESIAEHLEHFGYLVQTANNGEEALTICDDETPDIVITDLRMPVMNGFELIRELKGLHPKLPIIVTTGHANLEEEEEAVTDGASAVLWKPIRLNDLTKKLTELIN